MYTRLFASSGLSLDRLRALVEVGAYGSIVRAAGSDPVRQSLYSRQIKELEDFFQAGLVERHGRGVRLTARGRELARISRFFLLGLSNFQRGCLAEAQSYRLGCSETYATCFLLPMLSGTDSLQSRVHFLLHRAGEEEMERGLHDLTLDFAFVTRASLSRPLQVQGIGSWPLELWVPTALHKTESLALRALASKGLPLAWPQGELDRERFPTLSRFEPALVCNSFVEARAALDGQHSAAVLPGFLRPATTGRFLKVPLPEIDRSSLEYHLAWNPRLLRLNPHAEKRRIALVRSLSRPAPGKTEPR